MARFDVESIYSTDESSYYIVVWKPLDGMEKVQVCDRMNADQMHTPSATQPRINKFRFGLFRRAACLSAIRKVLRDLYY